MNMIKKKQNVDFYLQFGAVTLNNDAGKTMITIAWEGEGTSFGEPNIETGERVIEVAHEAGATITFTVQRGSDVEKNFALAASPSNRILAAAGLIKDYQTDGVTKNFVISSGALNKVAHDTSLKEVEYAMRCNAVEQAY